MRGRNSLDSSTRRDPIGTCGYGQGLVFPCPDVPGRNSSSRPSRSSSVQRSMFGVGCSAFAFTFISGCWAPVLGADAPATTFFDVTPGGVLAQLVTAAITALGTWGAITLRKPPAERAAPARSAKERVKLDNDPLRVELTETFASKSDFEELRAEVRGLSDKIAKQHACYAARADIDRLIETIRDANTANEARAVAIYERINPIAEAIAANKSIIDNHLQDHRAGKKGGC